eukprot:gene14814-17508_t
MQKTERIRSGNVLKKDPHEGRRMEVHFLTTDASTHNFEARVDAGKLHKATSSRHHDTAKPKGPLRLAPIKGNWERSTQVQYKPEPMSRSEGVNDSIDRRGIHCKDTPTVSSSGRLDGSDTKGLKNSIQSLKRELAQLGVKVTGVCSKPRTCAPGRNGVKEINEDGHEVVRFDNELMATSQRQWADGMPVNEEGSFTTWPGHLIRRRPALTLQERLSTNQNEGQGMKATVTKHLQKQAQRQLQEEHDDVMALKWN